MAAPPDRLGAHEAGHGLSELPGESFLPVLAPHPRRVAAEGAHPDAGEPLFPRLAAAATAELDCVAVVDPRLFERVSQRPLVELRVAARARKAADVDECLDSGLFQRRDELV